MEIKFYNVDNEEIKDFDLQNKGFWCEHGLSKEKTFIDLYGERFNLIINPEKETDKYAPDLFNLSTRKRADLKTQNQPFFKVKKLYNINPQYAVTFNLKDKERYNEKYQDIEIYFAVDWQVVRMTIGDYIKYSVEPMTGVWFIPFQKLTTILDDYPLHEYLQRKDDKKGNARFSYVVDLQDKAFERII